MPAMSSGTSVHSISNTTPPVSSGVNVEDGVGVLGGRGKALEDNLVACDNGLATQGRPTSPNPQTTHIHTWMDRGFRAESKVVRSTGICVEAVDHVPQE